MTRKSQEHGSILTHVKFIQQTPRNTMYKDPNQYISSIYEYSLLNRFKLRGVARNFPKGVPASGKTCRPCGSFFSPVLPYRYFFSKRGCPFHWGTPWLRSCLNYVANHPSDEYSICKQEASNIFCDIMIVVYFFGSGVWNNFRRVLF